MKNGDPAPSGDPALDLGMNDLVECQRPVIGKVTAAEVKAALPDVGIGLRVLLRHLSSSRSLKRELCERPHW